MRVLEKDVNVGWHQSNYIGAYDPPGII